MAEKIRKQDPTRDVNPASRSSEKEYQAAPVLRAEHSEGSFTRVIEQQTAKIPSDVFLFLSIGSMLTSAALELTGNPRASKFVGMWAPSLLIMGVYNKLVKVVGPR